MDLYHLQVLRGLDPGRRVSGWELSRKLGLPASAVSKSIGWLRTRNYQIGGGSAGGYLLGERSSSLYPWEVSAGLNTSGFGKKIHFFSELDSTNSLAFELALAGASEGEAVVAETQNRGRGRLDRVWISPPGVNIYASLILRPRVAMEQVAQISLLAALALARSCSRLWPVSPGLKWPNDVFLGDKKVAGILSEARTEGGEVRFVVSGIGINVNLDPGDLPGEVRARATSVAEFLGYPVSRLRLWRAFLEDFEEVYHDFLRRGLSPFLEEWDRRSILKGRRVKVSGGQEWEGDVTGLDPSGALRLNDREGKPRVVLAGDIKVTM
ncbi:MAG: biotin--[acetyl-CoA-carboxylase] ligase [Proteobacteria bacterium]|nr:biotin--[acetyl-CoA-carboxylase] ligase [Pseudomonadota bacterium]